MFRITRKADYAVFILSFLARRAAEEGSDSLVSAQELASFSALNKSLVANLLKDLTRAGFLSSVRGARGGYRLDRTAEEINLLEILRTVEGPFSFVECAQGVIAEPGLEGSEAAKAAGSTAAGSTAAGSTAAGSTAAGSTAAGSMGAGSMGAGSNGAGAGNGTSEASSNEVVASIGATGAGDASDHDDECCNLTGLCTSKGPLMVLHLRIQQLLEEISLAELSGLDNTRAAQIAQELFPSQRAMEAAGLVDAVATGQPGASGTPDTPSAERGDGADSGSPSNDSGFSAARDSQGPTPPTVP